MVRNVSVSAVAAVAAVYLAGCGNFFSLRPAAEQSHTSFILGTLFSTHLLASVFTVLVCSSRLPFHHFTKLHNKRPGYLTSIVWVLRGSWLHYIISAVAVVGMGVCCSMLPPAVDKFKLEYYLEAIIDQYFSSACDAYVRHLLRTETVEGKSKSSQSLQRPRGPFLRWWRSFVMSMPSLISLLVAGVYIHNVNRWRFSAGLETNIFVALSIFLKLSMQHLARRHLLRQNVTSLHQMFIVISVPTVVVDTQVRIVILRQPDSHSSMTNTALMAFIEISVRLIKIVWIRAIVRQRLRAVESEAVASAASQAKTGRSFLGVATLANDSRVHPHDPRVQFLQWQKQIVGLHTAETHADMYAEYIALICSAAIAVFWTGNPHYSLGTSGATSAGGLRTTLLLQLAIEVAVDYFVSVLEIANGIKLERTKGFGAFLGMLFLLLTVVNINMSAVLHIRERGS